MPGFGGHGKGGPPAPSGNPKEWFDSWDEYYEHFGGLGEVTISLADYSEMMSGIRNAKTAGERADRKGHVLDELDRLVALSERATVLIDAIKLRKTLWIPLDDKWNKWVWGRCRIIADAQNNSGRRTRLC